MGGSSADIEALLVDVNDPANPTPGMLPAIFRDIVGGLEAEGYTYAVVGRIALTLHEQARYVGAIEIVADLSADGRRCAAGLMKATRARFAAHMNPKLCPRPIELTLRPCICATEVGLLAEAITRPWFDVPARLATAEHLLWLWCHSDGVDHPADACALIAGGPSTSIACRTFCGRRTTSKRRGRGGCGWRLAMQSCQRRPRLAGTWRSGAPGLIHHTCRFGVESAITTPRWSGTDRAERSGGLAAKAERPAACAQQGQPTTFI